jgi:glycosyltransferase involved in cell wall biosynthesis
MYNAEKYIVATLDSCVNQTYENIEIIVVDDGSSDNSFKIAQDYEAIHANIKVFSQVNSGAPTARNRAFSESTGEYIQYLDADDLLDLKKIELQMKVLKKEPELTLAFGRVSVFFHKVESVNFIKRRIDQDYYNPIDYLIDYWSYFDDILPHSYLLSRKLVEKTGKWDESLTKFQDIEFFSRVAFNAEKVKYTPDSIVYYRKDNPNSISKQYSRKSMESIDRAHNTVTVMMKDYMSDKNVRRSLALIHSAFYHTVYEEYPDLVESTLIQLNKLGYREPIYPIQKGLAPYFLSKLLGYHRARKLIIATRSIRKRLKQ